jgi:hypothetical protein
MKNSKINKFFTITSTIPNDLTICIAANSMEEAYNKFKDSKFKNKLGKSIDVEIFPQSGIEISLISKNPNKSHLCYYQIKNERVKILIAESIDQCLDYLKDLDLKEIDFYCNSNTKFIF